jgi:tetratricopeptide (TPR) repeat protein
MKMKKIVVIMLIGIWICSVQAQNVSVVKVYEGQEEIPTYKLGKDETSPIFYTGRGVQGAAGHIYPYPAQTNLTDKLTNVTYNMVYLENEYLKVTILPEFGGKLFSAIDKTNGHELFHRNSVIKPDLIGTLGAWISGGVEWCYPNHHRSTTLMPADYFYKQNDDGSATVWVGETEKTAQLRGVIGITLRPGRSYIEVDYRLNNTNTVTKNFLFWANVAVTANENFRTSWPPSQEIGAFHSFTSFTHWPISHEIYKGVDYTAGVDLTWWKNHPDPISFFMWQAKEGFIGGYDYGVNAGTVHVGDINKNSTSKLWQFGPGLQGQNARRKLTDDGKAYVELMIGTFSNNQPDYSWFLPHSVKDAKNYWYPVRDLEIVKNANINATVTLQLKDPNTVFYGFNTTKPYKNTTAILKYGDKILAENTIDIDPAKPFTSNYKSDKNIDEYQLYVELQDNDGNKIISYKPYKLQNPELPEVLDKPKSPGEIESVEDLYLTGRFVEQFSRPGFNADDYYLEALKKSPDDYRVNTALGIRRVNQWRYQEAEEYLQRAADKLRIKYIQPKEGELYYYMGLAKLGLGKLDEAYQSFNRATWYYQWYSSAYYELALLECQKKNTEKALEYIKNAYSTDNLDGRISVLYSALLNKQGKKQEANELLSKLLDYDPLNFSAIYQRSLLQGNSFIQWNKNMQDVDNNYLDVASLFVNAGWYEDGINLLSLIENPQNPLINYYQAWFYANNNQLGKASELIKMADEMSLDYCFPYRAETEKVLKYVVKADPKNANACYLLGNLLYDKRPDEAMDYWEMAISIQDDFPMVWRNLAFGKFYHEGNTADAIRYIKNAIQRDPNQPIWYAELETYYDHSSEDFRDCLAIMEKHIDVLINDINAPKSLVKLYNLAGKYDKAIDLLSNHHFRTWEGGREIYYYYVDAHTLKALELMKAGDYKNTISELNTAMLYPENLEVGKSLNDDRNAMIYYFMGQAYKGMKNTEKAKECYQKSIDAKNAPSWPDLIYFQAKAYEELGNVTKAKEFFSELIENGTTLLEKGKGISGIGVGERTSNKVSMSEAYYLQALGNKGLGNDELAKELFENALEVYKNNLWAMTLSK